LGKPADFISGLCDLMSYMKANDDSTLAVGDNIKGNVLIVIIKIFI